MTYNGDIIVSTYIGYLISLRQGIICIWYNWGDRQFMSMLFEKYVFLWNKYIFRMLLLKRGHKIKQSIQFWDRV